MGIANGVLTSQNLTGQNSMYQNFQTGQQIQSLQSNQQFQSLQNNQQIQSRSGSLENSALPAWFKPTPAPERLQSLNSPLPLCFQRLPSSVTTNVNPSPLANLPKPDSLAKTDLLARSLGHKSAQMPSLQRSQEESIQNWKTGQADLEKQNTEKQNLFKKQSGPNLHVLQSEDKNQIEEKQHEIQAPVSTQNANAVPSISREAIAKEIVQKPEATLKKDADEILLQDPTVLETESLKVGQGSKNDLEAPVELQNDSSAPIDKSSDAKNIPDMQKPKSDTKISNLVASQSLLDPQLKNRDTEMTDGNLANAVSIVGGIDSKNNAPEDKPDNTITLENAKSESYHADHSSEKIAEVPQSLDRKADHEGLQRDVVNRPTENGVLNQLKELEAVKQKLAGSVSKDVSQSPVLGLLPEKQDRPQKSTSQVAASSEPAVSEKPTSIGPSRAGNRLSSTSLLPLCTAVDITIYAQSASF